MKKRITILVTFILCCVYSHAQTVRWMVAPEYASITHFSEDIFKCIDKNGNLQLLDWNGQSLLPKDIADRADKVTEYSDGYAVVMQGDKILGFLPEAKPHIFKSVIGDYYATKYSFFSEGYIAVAQGSDEGKQGYLDSNGNLVLKCQYVEAMPVRQGWAAVTENGKDPKTLPRRYKRSDDWSAKGMPALVTGESFVWVTSFNEDGYALAKVKGGKYIVFDTKFTSKKNNVNENKDENKRRFVNAYDYSYKPEGSDELVPPVNGSPIRNEDYITYDQGGKMGFRTSKESVVPTQFNEAQDFYANRAIVSMGGNYGIIELLGGEFVSHWSNEKVRVYELANKVESILFELNTPASLESSKIKLELDKGDGRYVDCNGLTCNFTVADQVVNRKNRKSELKVRATYCENGYPNLVLWEGTHDINISYISISLSNPVTTSEYADENDNQTVKAVVTNTSDVAVTVSVKLTVDGKPVLFKGELSPKQSKTMTATIKVDEDKQVQATISAEVDGHNCGSKPAYVSLKKI